MFERFTLEFSCRININLRPFKYYQKKTKNYYKINQKDLKLRGDEQRLKSIEIL